MIALLPRSPHGHAHPDSGFTLLEMGIVLTIIALVLGGGLVTITASAQRSAVDTTIARMDAIDAALLNYRVAQNRLPCPSDPRLASSNANYGVEAATPGTCTGGTPAANFSVTNGAAATQANAKAVEGGVPTRALELPDDFMFDAWGNHLRYAVDVGATATAAFSALPYNKFNSCGPLTVTGATGAARSTVAAYVVVSHGPNGHGAFTRSGGSTAYTYGSTNTDEQTNCHCDSSGVTTGYPGTGFSVPTYVQKLPTEDSTSGLNKFDDLVTYKEHWQLQSPFDSNTTYPSTYGISLVAVGPVALPYISAYQQTNTSFTKLTTPASPPSDIGYAAAFSPGNNLLAVGGNGAGSTYGLQVYTISGGVLQASPTQKLSGNTVRGVAFSNDGRLLAVSYNVAPYLVLYQPMQSYTTATLGTAPASSGGVATFSPDGKYFAMAESGSPFLLVYSVNCTTLTPVASAPAPGAAVNALSFSYDSKYLAVTSNSQATVYLNTAGTFSTAISAFGSNVVGAAFSRTSNNYLAVLDDTTLTLYGFSGGSVTSLTTAAASGTTSAKALAWARDDSLIAIANGSGDTGAGLQVFQVSGITMSAATTSANPGQTMNSVAFGN